MCDIIDQIFGIPLFQLNIVTMKLDFELYTVENLYLYIFYNGNLIFNCIDKLEFIDYRY